MINPFANTLLIENIFPLIVAPKLFLNKYFLNIISQKGLTFAKF